MAVDMRNRRRAAASRAARVRNILVLAVATALAEEVAAQESRRVRTYMRVFDRRAGIAKMDSLTDLQFRSKYRMERTVFFEVLHAITPILERDASTAPHGSRGGDIHPQLKLVCMTSPATTRSESTRARRRLRARSRRVCAAAAIV